MDRPFRNELLGVLLLMAAAVLMEASPDPLLADSQQDLALGAPASAPSSQSISWPELGVKATAQYSGDGLEVKAGEDGTVRLRCVFQRLEGEVTREGLWLHSTVDGTSANRFRVVADSVGREGAGMVACPEEHPMVGRRCSVACDGPSHARRRGSGALPPLGSGAQSIPYPMERQLSMNLSPVAASRESAADLNGQSQRRSYESPPHSGSRPQSVVVRPWSLPRDGVVACQDGAACFMRDGLVEEYSVSVDGVRQDFGISAPPGGAGPLRVDLAVTGARTEAMADGARLILDNTGRKITYNRLRVADANGRELDARLEVISDSRLAVLVEDAGAVYPIRIDPTFSDANWVSMSGLRGANGLIYATVVDDFGHLYVGGEFTVIGTVIANRIAKWNGFEWSALGSGMNNVVRALAVSGTNLYAAGEFTTAGGKTANRIAKWNGSTWSALGSGMLNPVYALAVSGTNLFAGGEFFGAGGAYTWRIAQWNGRVWSAIGTGEGPDGPVYALTVFGTNLYIGGDFSYVDRVDTGPIAKWNGRGWSSLDFGLAMGGAIHALAVSGNTLFVGGDFRGARQGFEKYNYIAKWNGSKWSALGSGMNAPVHALAMSGNTLYAGGAFDRAGGINADFIAKWNGTTWSSLGAGIGDDYYYYTTFST